MRSTILPAFLLIHLKPTLVMLLALWVALDSALTQGQPAKPNKPASSGSAAPKSTASDGPVPQSVFVMPRSPQEGKDPFFPRSNGPWTRYQPIPKPTTTTSTQPAAVTAELKLNGISGSADRRLAIINNRTFEVNEEGDVVSGSDRVRIRVLEIKADSVIVQFVSGGLRRELHFRKGL